MTLSVFSSSLSRASIIRVCLIINSQIGNRCKITSNALRRYRKDIRQIEEENNFFILFMSERVAIME